MMMNDKFFIIGMTNCGTSILSNILHSHKDIHCFKDQKSFELTMANNFVVKALKSMDHIVDFVKLIDVPRLGHKQQEFKSNNKINNFKNLINKSMAKKNTKLGFVKFNRLLCYKDVLRSAYPNMKNIIIIRDGKMYSTSGLAIGNPKIAMIRGQVWNEMMDIYFNSWYKDPLTLTIRFEDLCANPLEIINEAFEFLGVSKFKEIKQGVIDRNKRIKNFNANLHPKLTNIVVKNNEKLNKLVPLRFVRI